MKFRVWSSGFIGFRIFGLGFRVQGLFEDQNLGFRLQDLGFTGLGIQGLGFR